MSKIILISGASGVAKSSTSKKLSELYNITHRIGSGFVREMAKSFISEEDEPSLYRYSFYQDSKISAFENLYSQSAIIQPMMQLAINRAYREGTGLIVEGVNVIPGLTLMHYQEIQSIVLYVEDEAKHFDMINGDTHANRHVSKQQLKLVRDIQHVLIQRAAEFNWPAIDVTKEGGEHELRSYLL